MTDGWTDLSQSAAEVHMSAVWERESVEQNVNKRTDERAREQKPRACVREKEVTRDASELNS